MTDVNKQQQTNNQGTQGTPKLPGLELPGGCTITCSPGQPAPAAPTVINNVIYPPYPSIAQIVDELAKLKMTFDEFIRRILNGENIEVTDKKGNKYYFGLVKDSSISGKVEKKEEKKEKV